MDSLWVTGLGALIFFVSAVMFASKRKQQSFHSAFFVSAITCVSYVFMLQFPDLVWVRWLGYVFSCTTLVWVIGRYISLSQDYLLSVMFLTPLVMVTGALASFSVGLRMWLWFCLGSVFYGFLLWILWKGKKASFAHIRPYILFGWSVFPLVFLLSPEGLGVISLSVAVVLYLLLDIYTKIVFYKTIAN